MDVTTLLYDEFKRLRPQESTDPSWFQKVFSSLSASKYDEWIRYIHLFEEKNMIELSTEGGYLVYKRISKQDNFASQVKDVLHLK